MSSIDAITITEADLRALAPKARREYITAILGSLSQLRAAGILENELRWCHFIAQCAHETNGFTILRESLTYTSVKRIREVWPARFRTKSDAELAGLVRNPEALGDAVYGGRMGNALKGDGYAFRGGGLLQTTGRTHVTDYAKSLGLDPTPSLLDDVALTTQFACLEWQASGCSAHADENDIVKVSKAINVGSATSSVVPVGLDGRRAWFAKAWAIWGGKGQADVPAEGGITAKGAAIAGGTTLTVVEVARQTVTSLPPVPKEATEALSNVRAWRETGSAFWGLGSDIAGAAGGNLILLGLLALCGGGLLLMKWRGRRA